MLLRFLTTHKVMNVIQEYAPTSDKPNEEVEEFYFALEAAMDVTKKEKITIIFGHLYLNIGKGAVALIVD